jgi:ubiquinone/menaquinone biosynthesis C-methylase UbiE/uncharacterized protein YbaR (Trm112 family)
VEICCPACRGDLSISLTSETTIICQLCERDYPIIFGIPDLRIFTDPYLSIEEDRTKAIELAERFDHLNFEGMVSYYYQGKEVIPANLIRQYTRGMMAGEARAVGLLQSCEAMAQVPLLGGARKILEIGCGTAPLLLAAGKRGANIVGLDIGLRWLVIGKRRLADADLDIPLICACAEALPFKDQNFNVVMSESTLENLQNQEQALNECLRTLHQGGLLCLSTPNKYSLAPDPHTGLPAGGYLPEKWTAAIVRRQGGIPPRRRLLSATMLSRMISRTGFKTLRISLPDIPEGQTAHFGRGIRLLIRTYHILKRLPALRLVLRWIGPVYHVVAKKPETSSQANRLNYSMPGASSGS